MALLRTLAALAAAACAVTLREIMQLRAASGGGSAGLTLAAMGTGLALLAAVVLTFAPWAWWNRIRDSLRPAQHRLQCAETPMPIRTSVLLLIVAAAACFLLLSRFLSLPQNPWDDDQGAYLITAWEIHRAGGLSWLNEALWSGGFPEANRHPLYLALLSLHPTFRGGQILSASIGVAGLIVLTVGLGRRRGWDVAAVFAVLVATNAAFCQFSCSVVCDILMLVLGGAVWLLHLPRRSQGAVAFESGGGKPLLQLWISLTVGATLGLTWLTKGTGLVLLDGYLLWIAATAVVRCNAGRRARDQQEKPRPATTNDRPLLHAGLWAVGVVVAFAMVGSPLLIRNVKRFGNPFYNVNSLLLFADRYEDFEPMLQEGVTTGDAARGWLATHSLMDIVHREASGLVWELYIILRSLGPAPLDDARVLFGVPLALLAAVWMATRRSAADGLLLASGIVCWGVFAWYVPIAAGERFILPLLAPLLGTAAEAIVRLARTSPVAPRMLVVGAAMWCIVWTSAAWMWAAFD